MMGSKKFADNVGRWFSLRNLAFSGFYMRMMSLGDDVLNKSIHLLTYLHFVDQFLLTL